MLTSCSLVDPFVTPKKPDRLRLAESVPLADAFGYAEKVKEAYRSGLRHQAHLQSWLGIGLIPLTAAAIGLGATGTSPNTVIALGLAGTSALGVGTWLQNKPRQLAWVAGIKAVTCAEDAVIPLVLPDANTFDEDLKTLSTKIPILEQQVAAVSEIIDRFEPHFAKLSARARSTAPYHEDLLKDAKAELANAKSLITSADAAYSSGTDVQHVVNTAGQRLIVATNKIVDAVDGIIVETQRDPQALSTIIGGLGATYKTITTVPEPFKTTSERPTGIRPEGRVLPPPADEKQEKQDKDALDALKKTYDELKDGLKTLRDESTKLSEARRKVAAVVNMVSKDAPLKALESCGVKAGDVVTALAVDPAPPFQLAKSASMGFVVKGGVPPYAATIKGPSDGVSVVPAAPPFSAAFNLTASKDAQAGTYVLNLFDSTGQAKSVVVTVDGASAPKDGTSKTPGGGQAMPVIQEQFSELVQETKGKSFPVADTGVIIKVSDLLLDQGKVTLSVDVDSITAPKLDAFTEEAVVQAIKAKSASGITSKQIAIKDFGAVRKAAEARISAACGKIELEKSVKSDTEPLFTKLSDAERHKLQTAMCLKKKDVDGVWGPKTKHSLKQYQCRKGRTPDGKLTDDLLAELLKLTPEEVTKQCQVK